MLCLVTQRQNSDVLRYKGDTELHILSKIKLLSENIDKRILCKKKCKNKRTSTQKMEHKKLDSIFLWVQNMNNINIYSRAFIPDPSKVQEGGGHSGMWTSWFPPSSMSRPQPEEFLPSSSTGKVLGVFLPTVRLVSVLKS